MDAWPEFRWLNYYGWWPMHCKDERFRKVFRYFGYILFFFDFVQILPEFIALYIRIVKGSWKDAILNMNTTMMGTMCALKLMNLFFKEERIIILISKIDELKSLGRSMLGDKADQIMRESEKRAYYIRCVTKVFIYFSIHWILTPFILTLNGIKKPIIDSWTPWSQETWGGWALTMGFQIPHVFSTISAMFCVNCLVLNMLEGMLCNFKILAKMLTMIDFEKSNNLKSCVKFHQEILWLAKEFDSVFGFVQQIQCGMIVVSACFSVIEITNPNTPLSRILNLAELIAVLAFFFFFDCYLSQSVSEASSNLTRSAYGNNWYFASLKDRKILIFIHERTKIPIIFGGIVQIELRTYINVMKSVFSYYNFLQALELTS